jgi:hypothetical protein
MLIFLNPISRIDPLKRAWISIYASKRCQCQTCIDFIKVTTISGIVVLWTDEGFPLTSANAIW